MPNTIKNPTDHDLLTRLDQKVSDLQVAVKDLTDGTISKIAGLEKDKADKDEVQSLQKKVNDDIEVRVRNVETSVTQIKTYGTTLVLFLGVIEFFIQLYFKTH